MTNRRYAIWRFSSLLRTHIVRYSGLFEVPPVLEMCQKFVKSVRRLPVAKAQCLFCFETW